MVIDKAKTITRGRQTKILATLGPASDTKDMIRDLFVAGVDNFRLNFSHGAHDDHRKRLEMIRAVEKEFSCFANNDNGLRLHVPSGNLVLRLHNWERSPLFLVGHGYLVETTPRYWM